MKQFLNPYSITINEKKMKNLFNKSFINKKVIITGHTGFKGSWLSVWLKLLGANVIGISLNTITKPSHFVEANISKGMEDIRIDIKKNYLY